MIGRLKQRFKRTLGPRMNYWEWESFEALLNGPGFEVSDPGPLRAPISRFTIKRDKKRNLILKTLSAGRPERVRDREQLGAMRHLTESVQFTNEFGFTATATAVHTEAERTKYDPHTGPQCWQSSFVGDLEIVSTRRRRVAVTIDWLENVDRESCRWVGEMIKTKRTKSDSRTIGEGASAVTMRARGLKDEHSHAALQMEVGGITLFLCAARDVRRRVWPGYILYQGAPNAETRRRMREVVGFAVGSGFVYLGSTGLTKASELVWTSATSGNPFGDQILKHPADPPAPVGSPFEHVLEQGQVSRVAAALFDHYDELNFRALSWAYWHAVCAPGHIAAGHFGAAIEAVQEAYLNAHPEKRLGKLIADPKLAAKVRWALNDALAGLPLDALTLSALQSKLAHVNQPSGATVSSRLIKQLDLEWGPGERGAWKRRNEAAHGKARRPEDSIPVARDTVILRTLLNRIVLRIATASPTYIDRYTPGYKVRALRQPVPQADS